MLWKLGLALVFAWALVMPPLFTHGACTAEFDAESRRIDVDRALLGTPAYAAEYWQGRGLAYYLLSQETCRRSRPRFVADCGDGTFVYARVPVHNAICRVYRDDNILVQLYYDRRERLARTQVDMAPFKSLPIPFTHAAIDWAR
jgi:hypothetical protein